MDPFHPLPGASEAFYAEQVAGFVDGGFVVVATDYQGLGAGDGIHPFLVGETAAYNVLDAARAARALPGLDLGADTLIWGTFARGPCRGVGGPAGSLLRTGPAHQRGHSGRPGRRAGTRPGGSDEWPGATAPTPLTGYIVTLVSAWSQVYPETAAAPALTPAALAKLDLVTDACIPEVAAAYGDRPLADYIDAAVLMAPPWDILLERNAAGRLPISAPILVVQGTADPLVPLATTEAFVQRLCGLGSAVQFNRYPDVGHGAVIAAAMPDMLAWAAHQQEGNDASSTC